MAFKFDSNTPIVDSMGRPSPELLRVLNRWLLRSGGGSTAEPSTPTGLAYSMDPAGVRLSCDANPAGEDIIGYEWRYGSTWDTASVISPLGSREIVWNNNAAGTYTVWVKAENIRGIYSPAASMVVVVTETAMGIYGPEVNLTYDRIAFLNQKNGAGVSPAQINFTANTLNLSSPTFQWKVDGVVQVGETASTFALPSFDSGSKVVRCDATSASLGVSAYDQYTVWVVNEGDDAYAWTLTNEDQAISVDYNGNPVAGLPATGTFAVARGSHGLGVTGAVTFSVASTTNATASIDSLTGSYSVTAISADTASVTFQAVVTDVPGGPTLQRTMTLHKSYPGNGKRIQLTSATTVYRVDVGGTPDPVYIAVTANLLNGLTGTATWSVISGTATIAPSGNSCSLSYGDLSSDQVTIRATIVEDGITYTADITLYKAFDGATGTTGDRGSLTGYGSKYGISSGSWSDTQAQAVIYNMLYGTSITSYSGTSHLRIGDTVTLSNGSSFSATKYWGGTSWLAPGVVIDGNLLVSGTVSASALNVSTLSAITANLGTVNAGTISGTANLDIGGTAKINGSTSVTVGGASQTAALAVNNGQGSPNGVVAYSGTDGGAALYGFANSANSSGVYGQVTPGFANCNGVTGNAIGSGMSGVRAVGTSGATALQVSGPMTIDNSTLVANFNAHYLNGYQNTDFALAGHNHSGVYLPVSGTAADSSALGGYSVGSWMRQSGFTAGNPGTSFTHTITVVSGGITVRVPCFYP